jgi:hypothetical protein
VRALSARARKRQERWQNDFYSRVLNRKRVWAGFWRRRCFTRCSWHGGPSRRPCHPGNDVEDADAVDVEDHLGVLALVGDGGEGLEAGLAESLRPRVASSGSTTRCDSANPGSKPMVWNGERYGRGLEAGEPLMEAIEGLGVAVAGVHPFECCASGRASGRTGAGGLAACGSRRRIRARLGRRVYVGAARLLWARFLLGWDRRRSRRRSEM